MKDNLIKAKFNLPNSWNIGVLENLTNQIVDGTHFTPKYTESGMPFLRVTDVQTKEINFEKIKFISLQEHEILKKRCNPSKGDLLLSKNGTIGIPKIVDWDWEFSIFVSLALIKLKRDLDINYLYHFFKSDIFQWQIIRRAKQGTVTNLHLEEIRELEIPLLSLPQQKKIAKILSTCDEVIEKTEAAIAKYKAIKQGMMHDLFTRGIDTTTGKLRPSYQEAPELYKESALGMIPKEWEVKRLGHICNVTSSKRIFLSDYQDSGIPFFRGKEITQLSKNQEINDIIYISFDRYNQIKKDYGVPIENDILITSVGTLGSVYQVRKDDLFYFKDGNLIWLKDFIIDNLDLFYLYLAVRELIKSQMDDLVIGTSQSAFTIDKLKKMKIVLPLQKSEQIEMSCKIKALESSLQEEEASLSKYKKIKEGLMQDLLTGRVEVSE